MMKDRLLWGAIIVTALVAVALFIAAIWVAGATGWKLAYTGIVLILTAIFAAIVTGGRYVCR